MLRKPNNFDDTSNNSSCSSFGSNNGTGVCRICHVAEPKRGRNYQQTKTFHDKQQQQQQQQNLLTWLQGRSDDNREDELIAPCECRGTMQYVHRGCLNQWRTASPRSDSFTRCEQCFASYTFKNTRVTGMLMHPAAIYTACVVLFGAWVAASTFVSTGAFYRSDSDGIDSELFNLLPIINFEYFESPFLDGLFPSFLPSIILQYNNVLNSLNSLFYGLIFVALTEYIFFTPSFILSFNTLFCIWRIQRYDIFFDKWLLVAFTGFGMWRAARSLHLMIEAAVMRVVKLKLLEVKNRED